MHGSHTFVLLGFLSLPAMAGASADYQLAPVSSDGGGLTGSSEDYQINFSTAPGEAGSSPAYGLRTGFSGQLLDAVELRLDAADSALTLGERASRQLGASLGYDDGTSAPLAAEAIAWSVQSGPLAEIDSGGIVTAGTVYQDSPAVARAIYQTFAGTLEIQVINTGNDDFGSYAGDGLSDSWQVGYFGEEDEDAAPSSDPDADGLNNLQEYAFGMNPLQSFAGMLRWSGTDLLEPGVPMPFASGTAGSFTFRAVFARRKDYAAAGLSYTVEFSGDLSTWRASTSTPVVVAEDDEVQAVSVPYPFFVNAKKATFFRVKVQSN
ncbi:MAG: hypothetical protein WEB53_16820 [Akkermansiaceae bacterium]